MADPQDTPPRFSLAEFRDLSHRRDCMAYQVVGGTREALASLNLGEVEQATHILLRILARYEEADAALNEFRKQHFPKEESHGNSTTQPAA